MTPETRDYTLLRTVHYMRMGMYDYAIVEDTAYPDNYVQFGVYGAQREMVHVEVTSRRYDDQVLPPLTRKQVDALVKLGLSRRKNPNHQVDLESPSPQEIVTLCERAFAILGSTPDFDLNVKTGYWHDNPIWDQLARAKGYHDDFFEEDGRLLPAPGHGKR